MEPTENQEVTEVVTEESHASTEPDLSQVEVMSNGQEIDLTSSESENSDDKAAESEEKVATPNPDDVVQKDSSFICQRKSGSPNKPSGRRVGLPDTFT